jgi:hypothetical protein
VSLVLSYIDVSNQMCLLSLQNRSLASKLNSTFSDRMFVNKKNRTNTKAKTKGSAFFFVMIF